MIKLHGADNLFLAYYYRVILHGTYPLISDTEVANFKKFTREVLNIAYKSNFIESGIIGQMRKFETRSQLSKAIRFEFAKLFKMPDRPKVLLEQLLLIKQKITNLQAEAKMSTNSGETSMVNGINPVKPISQSILEDKIHQESNNVRPAKAAKIVNPLKEAAKPARTELKILVEPAVSDVEAKIVAWQNTNGRRFRMLKEQKNRGLTREQAFMELHP